LCKAAQASMADRRGCSTGIEIWSRTTVDSERTDFRAAGMNRQNPYLNVFGRDDVTGCLRKMVTENRRAIKVFSSQRRQP
jgi:hypothetical protein